jgi:hypothetical protein
MKRKTSKPGGNWRRQWAISRELQVLAGIEQTRSAKLEETKCLKHSGGSPVGRLPLLYANRLLVAAIFFDLTEGRAEMERLD